MTWKQVVEKAFNSSKKGRYMFVISAQEMDEQDHFEFSDDREAFSGSLVLEVFDRTIDFNSQYAMKRAQ